MTNFQTEYKKLNAAQKQAVDQVDGPVMVLAGPGTGKTQVLALRIANILRRTQMNPYNILCLTFTESAAHEMRKRLTDIIGNSAYDVGIYTFHGFANSIIKDFPYTFNHIIEADGKNALIDFKPLDEFSRLKIIEKLLTTHHWARLTPLKSNLIHLNQISKHVQDFKREQIDPKLLRSDANKYIIEQESRRQPGQTKTKTAVIDVEIQKAKRTLELAALYELYNAKLAKGFLYDYEDMINWVVGALMSDPELSLIYQEKYQYILVDEFQDTNSSQLELLNQLTIFYKNNPNLFVVGDPNQSIYRFQGASNYNLEQFKSRYRKAAQIELTINYRSGQNIIDAASEVIKNNAAPVSLVARNKISSKITLSSYLHREQELFEISQKITMLIKSGVKAGEIAILVRKNDQISDFITALNSQRIPFQVVKGDSVLPNPFIEKILLLIDVLVDPSDKYKLSQLFYYFRDKLTFKDAQIIKKAIFSNRKIIGLSVDAKNFLQKINDVSKDISEIPIANALVIIYQKFGILDKTTQAPDRLEKLGLLKSLYNSAKQETGNLPAWLEKLRAMQQYHLDLQSEPILYGQEEAVVISTVHQAKGKEYRVVYLPQMQQNIWSKVNRSIFYIPPLSPKSNQLIATEDEIAEERRLFYVGLTRAKSNLFISYSSLDGEKELTVSRFVKELPQNISPRVIGENEKNIIKRISTQLAPTPPLSFSELETAWLKDTIAKQSLSPTGFTTYKNCPKNYLFKNILRLPQVKSPSQAYGTAIHFALENYFQSYRKTSLLPSEDELLGYYKIALENESQLNNIEKEKFKNSGNELLANYFDKQSPNFQIPIKTEHAFRSIYCDDIPLSGKVDKIEWLDPKGKTVRVIDYKTGHAKSRNALLGLTKYKDTDYLYQLKFYWLLACLDHRFYLKWKIGECALEFLDSESKFTKETFTFCDKEIDELKSEITVVWNNILDLKFEHNPESKHCDFCNIFE